MYAFCWQFFMLNDEAILTLIALPDESKPKVDECISSSVVNLIMLK